MPEKDYEIFNCSAKGQLEFKINLTEIMKLLDNVLVNENFRGRRAEIKLFEGDEKIGSILLYTTGKYILTCKDPDVLPLAHIIFKDIMRRFKQTERLGNK